MPTLELTEQTISLARWASDETGWKNLGVPQRLFGEMLKLAFPVVEHYHGDFYHDAMWIDKNIAKDNVTEFFYGFDDCGTVIGTDSNLACIARRNVIGIRLFETDRRELMLSIRPVQENAVK